MNLVGADGDQIRLQRGNAERKVQEGLNRVGVKERVGGQAVGQLGHACNGHDGADLVVDGHDRNQDRILPQRRAEGVHGDPTLGVRGQIGDLKAHAFQLPHRVQDRVVLDLGRNDMLPALLHAAGSGKNRPVVSLRAAGSEKDPLRVRAEGLCHLQAGRAHAALGLDAQTVQRAWIAPGLGQRLRHGPDGLRAGLRGGGIVKICDHSSYFPTQKRSKILCVTSSRTVRPVSSPMASIAASSSIRTASGVIPSRIACCAARRLSAARRTASA